MRLRDIPLVIFFMLPLASAAEDTEQIQTHLGTIEAWRVFPEAVARYCKRIDPDGDSIRQEKLNSWSLKHAGLISQIDARFNELIPKYYSPRSNAQPEEAAKAQIVLHLLRKQFTRKTDKESVSYCREYAGENFHLWSSEMREHAKFALQALEKVEK